MSTLDLAQVPNTMDLDSSGDMPAQVLDFDVLLVVISFAWKSTIAAMMRTCSILYSAGAKHLLDENLSVPNTSIRSFCRFIIAEDGARFPLLRYLRITGAPLSPRAGQELLSILPRMFYLEGLTITNAEELLESAPKLGNAFAQLRFIRSLRIDQAGAMACQMVRRMKSKIVSLRLEYGYDDDFAPFLETVDEDELPQYHPTMLCQAFSSSIEELCIQFEDTGLEITQAHRHCLHLWKLCLQDPYPLALPYIKRFPNLVHLSVNPGSREWAPIEHHFQKFHDTRETNTSDQAAHGTWTHLREYDGDILGLYLMGLTCQIPRLILQGVDKEHLKLLRPILDAAKPVDLALQIRDDLWGDSEEDIPALLRLPGSASLTALSLDVDISSRDHLMDILISMANVRESLTALPLASFQLSLIARDSLDPTPRSKWHFGEDSNDSKGIKAYYRSPAHTPAPWLPVERTLQEFDPPQYARQLFDAVATLQEVIINVHGPRGRDRSLRLERGKDGVVLPA